MKPMRTVAALCMFFFILQSPLVCAQPDWREVDWGEFIVRVGGSYLHPDDDSTAPKFRVLQHWDLYNTRWEVSSETTWNIDGVWRPMEHWGAELMYIDSARYDVDLSDFTGTPGRNFIRLGDFEATSTSLFANWYPLGAECLGRPYFGIGVTYTDFDNIDLNPEFSTFLIDTKLATGSGSMGLSHSWGWAGQMGVDFSFGPNHNWLVNAAVVYFESDSDVTITFPTKLGQEHLYADFDYNPWTLNLGVGYRFGW